MLAILKAHAMGERINVKVIIGSTREGRFGDKPAAWIYNELRKEPSVDAELLDLREYPIAYYSAPESPAMHTGGYSDRVVQRWSDKIGEADAFIIVTPEYNHGYPAVLKSALDIIYKEWNNKPVGFVSYGSALGARSVEQLRQVAIELQMAPIHNAIHLPVEILHAHMASARGGAAFDTSMFDRLRTGPSGDRVAGFFSQLLWWARALKAAREADGT